MIAIVVLLLAITSRIVTAEDTPHHNISAIFAFGDSTFDSGNNNWRPTLVRANHEPYGCDFPDSEATGRFSDGRLITDFLVSSLGIKDLLPPYSHPSDLTLNDLTTGVSFASAGSGLDNQTADSVRATTIDGQVAELRNYDRRVRGFIGDVSADRLMRDAMFLVSAGSNDMMNYYASDSTRKPEYNISEYHDFLLQSIESFIQKLYGMHGRKFMVLGLPPIGCLPYQMTKNSQDLGNSHFGERVYGKGQNDDAINYNTKLQALLTRLQSTLQGSKVAYIDIFNPLMEMVWNPRKHGFAIATEGCCGTGLIEMGLTCSSSSGSCDHPSDYVFWDAVHLSEAANKKLAKGIMDTISTLFSNPNFKVAASPSESPATSPSYAPTTSPVTSPSSAQASPVASPTPSSGISPTAPSSPTTPIPAPPFSPAISPAGPPSPSFSPVRPPSSPPSSPTTPPSLSPTTSPSASPTVSSSSPSNSPTASPSTSPSSSPVKPPSTSTSPSPTPSSSPIASPCPSPSPLSSPTTSPSSPTAPPSSPSLSPSSPITSPAVPPSSPSFSPTPIVSPYYPPLTSPTAPPSSPSFSPTAPPSISFTSPTMSPSPSSSPTSPLTSPTMSSSSSPSSLSSPLFSPIVSPTMSPSSPPSSSSPLIAPIMSPSSPSSSSSPSFSPTIPPSSPSFSPTVPPSSSESPSSSLTSPTVSPSSSPSSPSSPLTSPTTPPSSPSFSPTTPPSSSASPTVSPSSPSSSPSSPLTSPIVSPTMSPSSPLSSRFSPLTSPIVSPSSPSSSPSSPLTSPTPTVPPSSPSFPPTAPPSSSTPPTSSLTSPIVSPSAPPSSSLTSPTMSPSSQSPSPSSPLTSPIVPPPTISLSSPSPSPSSPLTSPIVPPSSPLISPTISPSSPPSSSSSPLTSPTLSPSPTTAPSSPSSSPIVSPSSPLASPTAPPSSVHPSSPTPSPSSLPSSPILAPTPSPTTTPTPSPSSLPSSPILAPTSSPTTTPVASPFTSPSSSPSASPPSPFSPVVSPSPLPTHVASPTLSPSCSPTISPSSPTPPPVLAHHNITAVFAFGDSTVDSGRNNWLPTYLRANHPPYGRDFPNGVPTGRFSNGRLITDFLVSSLELKDLLPPYTFQTAFSLADNLTTGVSFASAGSGFDSATAMSAHVSGIDRQLADFRTYNNILQKIVGNQSNQVIKDAVFIVSAGFDDMLNYYTPFFSRRLDYDISGYQVLLLQSLQSLIKELYELSARKFIITGLPPIGCTPLQITRGSISFGSGQFGKRVCVESQNDDSTTYNTKLQALLTSMQSSLQEVKIVYADLYSPLMDMIQNPSKHSFTEATKGCCGTGLFETDQSCRWPAQSCSDPSKFVFWDSVHLSQAANEQLAKGIMDTVIPNLQ